MKVNKLFKVSNDAGNIFLMNHKQNMDVIFASETFFNEAKFISVFEHSLILSTNTCQTVADDLLIVVDFMPFCVIQTYTFLTSVCGLHEKKNEQVSYTF